ncbi:hypothetical protein M5J20_07055 [Corynebacterium sp. TA-R-1]|uniref:TIGR02569 family protein n=1 Tax=Corynebacterium stercoris TaxID=2943490 RepID=A0ABT1G5F9_9CORY|nr:hypothetical protein [Corynebacterium stercoris]MCP1387947.1 hypothetical protein [Corynebacterium stercoris]
MQIPAHVLAAFQAEGAGEPVAAAWGPAQRFGRMVIAPAPEHAAWSGKVRERITGLTPGLRVSRPVRATDGRLVVGGLTATEFVPGSPAARIDEVIAGTLLFDGALHGVEAPPNLEGESASPWVDADRDIFSGLRHADDHVVAHLDFLSSCLFDGSAPPSLIGIAPSLELRPRGYTAALVIVDGLLAHAVDPRVVQRWAHIPRLPELCRLALKVRELGWSRTDSNKRADFRRVAEILPA